VRTGSLALAAIGPQGISWEWLSRRLSKEKTVASEAAPSRVLEGKKVLVTGAGSGLGRAYVTHAARSGAEVGVNDIDIERAETVAQELDAAGLSALPIPGDISDWDAADGIVSAFVEQCGRIDGIVSNAGVFYRCLPWEDSGPAIARLVAINLLGVLYGGIHAMRRMVDQGSGSIVNITSGSQLGIPGMGSYGASKGGVASATYSWALDLRGTGVRVNAVSPLANTNMGPGPRPPGSENRPPLPTPDHVAPLVTYLLSDLAESMMGQVLRLEGPELSILHHPSIPDNRILRPKWTVEDIAAAIEGPLATEVRKVGRDP
jgi:NAD(P)-dependent dehydrogenase (short-subunit alcohol dehydrogenase family)